MFVRGLQSSEVEILIWKTEHSSRLAVAENDQTEMLIENNPGHTI